MGIRSVWIALAACAVAVIVSMDAHAAEFRAFYIDAWGAGIRSKSEVQALLGTVGSSTSRGAIREANCNAVVVQVRRRADVCYPSAKGEPYYTGLSPSNYNALADIIAAAHDTTGGKQRIEVHCWIATLPVTSTSSPPANSIYYQHDDPSDSANYWITRDSSGAEGDEKFFDPGHPRCLQYLLS